MNRNKVIWALKQLLPLPYETLYGDEDGKWHNVTWNMFLGRCFNIKDHEIKGVKK